MCFYGDMYFKSTFLSCIVGRSLCCSIQWIWGVVAFINSLRPCDAYMRQSTNCRRQAIICTSAGILLIGPLGTNFSKIQIGIQTFSFKKMRLKVSSAKWRPFCLGLNVLSHWGRNEIDAIFQTTVSKAFCWMKMYWFQSKFHWSLSPRVQSTIPQHRFR